MNYSPLNEDRIMCALDQYSFSDEAASLVRTGHPQLSMQNVKDIKDVWQSIEEGNLGMIPLENSSGGVVWPHLEKLMKEQQLQIAAAVRLQVRMCAGGLPGTDLSQVTHVHSHPKGLEQSTTFIGKLPSLKQKVEAGSTVGGVEQVTALQDIQHIALASESAIKALGLSVIARDVADLSGKENVTKFLVVHKNGEAQLPLTDRLHHATLITPNEINNKRGMLAGILNQITGCSIDLRSIHSRSVGPRNYAFYMEMFRDGSPQEMDVLADWLKVSPSIESSKWLGSWDEEYSNE